MSQSSTDLDVPTPPAVAGDVAAPIAPDSPIELAAPSVDQPPPEAEASGVSWVCRACAGAASDRPGNCPRCGLALDPSILALDGDAVDHERQSLLWRLKLSFAVMAPVLALSAVELFGESWPIGLPPKLLAGIAALAATPVVLVGGWPILLRGWRSLRAGRPNIYTITCLSVVAAYLFGLVLLGYAVAGLHLLTPNPNEATQLAPAAASTVAVLAPASAATALPFLEAAGVIVFLTLFGQLLERQARARTTSAIRKLLRLTPRTARVVAADGLEEVTPLEKVRPGDRVSVRTGEHIPVDGIIITGDTTVDESHLTGEAQRSGKGPGMTVAAGSENGIGPIVVEAVHVGAATAIAHVIALIAQAQRTRDPIGRTVDRAVAWFVPVVLILAALTFAIWALQDMPDAATRGIVAAVGVLVAACPVALGLATPVAVAVGLRRASRAGILFRDGAALERLAAVDTIVFDKTGTLTVGNMKFVGVRPNVALAAEEVLALAAAVERGSRHPIGLAIVWEAYRRGLEIARATDVVATPGKGVVGRVGDHRVVVGQRSFLQHSGVHFELMAGEAQTEKIFGNQVIFVGRDEKCIGLILLHDPMRPTAPDSAAELRAAGLRLFLATGDHLDVAKGVADRLGISEVAADQSPLEKFALVERLRKAGAVVAMCGDGVNDAPALAAADIGIAMGTGTDVAITVAAVALVKPDLRGVASAHGLSRSVVRAIRQNLLIALIFPAVAVPLAAGVLVPFGGGLISPVWGAMEMTVGVLAIVANSLRLARRKPEMQRVMP